tara:strand:+ start:73 stop:507 length:435 start_codon:yes stop_codon:yes gene_type:complete
MSDKVEAGKNVAVHYEGTFEDGTVFDSSKERGEPLTFQVGANQVVPGFESAVLGMTVGETKDVSLSPESAYGEPNPEAVQVYKKTQFPEDVTLTEGHTVAGQNGLGQPMVAKILKIEGEDVTLDFNHPLAGKTLNFNIEVVGVN